MTKRIVSFFIVSVIILASCKKDYIVGGTNEDINKYKNTLTTDVIKQEPVYDTMALLIEAAGMQNEVNATGTTFFCPNNSTIRGYLINRSGYVSSVYGEGKQFGLDSLLYYLKNNINHTRDSIKMYIVHPLLNYGDLTETGKYYTTALPGTKVAVSYEKTYDPALGYSPLVSTVPRLVYLTYMLQDYPLNNQNPISDVPDDVGIRVLCKLSGVPTKNGIMDGLSSGHELFFSKWRGSASK